MNSNHVSSLYATSTHWFWVERNSVVKVGVESTASTMVTWLSAQMCFITIWVSTTSCHGKIWSTSLVKLCMVDTLLMIGIEEQMLRIWKCFSSQNYFCLTSTCSIIFSNHQIQPNLITKVIENTLKKKCHQRYLRCLVCIPMLKSDILPFSARHCLIHFWKLKEDQEVEEVETKTNKLWQSSLISKQEHLLNSRCLISLAKSKIPKIKLHLLSSACKNAKEWITFFRRSREV